MYIFYGQQIFDDRWSKFPDYIGTADGKYTTDKPKVSGEPVLCNCESVCLGEHQLSLYCYPNLPEKWEGEVGIIGFDVAHFFCKLGDSSEQVEKLTKFSNIKEECRKTVEMICGEFKIPYVDCEFVYVKD